MKIQLKNKSKALSILVLIITCYFIVYMCLLVRHNKKQRLDFIKNFDQFNNETNYYYRDSNTDFENYKIVLNNVQKLQKNIKKLNNNKEIFNPNFVNDGSSLIIVILIQVHDRIEYLAEVISSLKNVQGIQKSLLIFSHDYFDEDINELIQRISFCSFMQIFYPYSRQLYPDAYPGEDSKFCSTDWQCIPSRGERNATLAQVKLHWWWKVNYVFNNIEFLQNFDGPVLFLEDDQYVSKDLIYTAKLLEALAVHECPDCFMISVAAERPQLYNYHSKNPMSIEEFGTTPYNMGIAFNRSIWNIIKDYGHHFCNFNDYRWTSSLRFLSTQLPQRKMYMFSIAGPRIFHIGRCGLSTPESDCEVTKKLEFLEKYLQLVSKGLFPKAYELRGSYHQKTEIVEIGHFSDIRDQELCDFFTKNAQFRNQ